MATVSGLETLLGNLGLDTPVPQFRTADVLAKPIDVFRGYLAALLGPTLALDAAAIYEAISSTTDISLGDLDVIIPRLKVKTEDVRRDFKSNKPVSPLFQRFLVDDIHIRCYFSPHNLPRFLFPYIESRGRAYGQETSLGLKDPSSPEKGSKKIVVEFSSPNIATEFNDTHLRSTIVGSFISNVHECMGCNVVRLNYLGDWGKQIGLLAVGWKRYGDEDKLSADPIGHLLDTYARIEEDFKPELQASKEAKEAKQDTASIEGQGIFAERDAFFKKMEDGDADALALWKKFRQITIDDLETAYKRMGVRFDEYSGESEVNPDTIIEVEEALKEKGILEESNGSWIIDFTKHKGVKKGLGIAIVRGRTGSTTYLLRDIAAAVDRDRKYNFDKMIYVVSSRQDLHFAQLFSALGLMGRSDLREKLQHVSFGRIQGLSDHLTGARTLGTILDQSAKLMRDAIVAEIAKERAEEERENGEEGNGATKPELPAVNIEAIGDITSVSAILDQDMSHRRSSNSNYDPKRMTSHDGYTGLQLQECHARLTLSIAELREQAAGSEDVAVDYGCLEREEPAELLRMMAQYPEMTSSAFRSLEPNAVLSYLHRLADAVSLCLDPPEDDDDSDSDEDEAEEAEPTVGEARAMLQMYETARLVLENGVRLLGMPIVA